MSSDSHRTRVQSMGVTTIVKADGNNIPMISFLNDFVGGTIIGMIESLRDVKPTWKQINVFVDKRFGIRTMIRIDEDSIPVGGYVSDMVAKIALSLLEGLKGIPANWLVAEFQVKRRMF